VDEKGPGTELLSTGLTFRDRLLWSPDGKRIYAEAGPSLADLRKAAAADKLPLFGADRTVVFDVATKKWSSVPLPPGHRLIGERPDGLLLTVGRGERTWHWFMTTADGKMSTRLDVDVSHLTGNDQLSADGKRVLSTVWDEAKPAVRLVVVDLTTKKIKRLTIAGLPKGPYVIERARWSPDGKKIAFYYLTLKDTGRKEHWSRWKRSEKATLCVCGADGKGMKAIRKDRAERFYYFEWK
jgi:Tol biopolymer transport system component